MVIDKIKLLEEIKKLIGKIYRVKSYTEYYCLVETLLSLIGIYEIITEEIVDFKIPMIDKYEGMAFLKTFNSSDINSNDFYCNRDEIDMLTMNLIKVFNKSNFIYLDRSYSLRKLNDIEYHEILEDFLHSFDERLFKTYAKMLDNNLVDHTIKKEPTNESANTYLNDKSYILLDYNPTIDGIATFAHELGHSYQFEKLYGSRKQMFDFNKSFYEFYSHVIELAFFDYLKKNHIYLKDTMIEENNFYFNYMINAESIYFYRNIKTDDLDTDELFDLGAWYQYTYSRVLATIMYERYLSDKKDTIKRIDSFISKEGLIDKSEQLKVLGVSKIDLFDTKILSKSLENHQKMIKKYS